LSAIEASGRMRRQFTNALLRDVRALEVMLDSGAIETGVRRIGAEQEMFLTDRSWRPAPFALELLAEVDDPHLVTEVGAFNLELNLDPEPFHGNCLSAMEHQLNTLLDRVRAAAADLGVEVVLAGILPTIRKSDLGLSNMVDNERYRLLNDAISNLRGREVDFYIKGADELRIRHDSVMLEACNASFQVHLQTDRDHFANEYNIAQLLAGPVLACATNSPLLFGRRLWAETRIAVFQQSVDTRRPSHHLRHVEPRVFFGDRWLKKSVIELHREDISRFPPLLPDTVVADPFEQIDAGQAPGLHALRLHTGTVWRWNRGCYGVSSEGVAHLRIECRVLPAGPTPLDEIANAALWLGAMTALSAKHDDITRQMDFENAKGNFLAAARQGLTAPMFWLKGEELTASRLVLDHLLPLAEEGLSLAGVDLADRTRYLEVIERRVLSGKTGSRWMLQSLAEMGDQASPGQRLDALTAAMTSRQRSSHPVADWTLAQVDEAATGDMSLVRVEQIMTTDFHSVNEADPVALVVTLMEWHRDLNVMVEDGTGQLVGVVPFHALLALLNRGAAVDLGSIAVSEMMQRDPVDVVPEMDALEALEVMRANGLSAVPVVQSGQLVGVLHDRHFVAIAHQSLSRSRPPR